MFKNILFRSVPFVLCNLMAPEGAQGGGGSDPTQPETPPTEEPKPEGATLEARFTSATGIIGKIFGHMRTALSSLKTEQDAHTETKGQLTTEQAAHTTTKGLLKTEQDAHTTTRGELSTAKTTISGLTTERDIATKNVTRLEKLCDLRGVDHKEVVGADASSTTKVSQADYALKLAAAKTPEARAEICAEFEKAVKEKRVTK